MVHVFVHLILRVWIAVESAVAMGVGTKDVAKQTAPVFVRSSSIQQ